MADKEAHLIRNACSIRATYSRDQTKADEQWTSLFPRAGCRAIEHARKETRDQIIWSSHRIPQNEAEGDWSIPSCGYQPAGVPRCSARGSAIYCLTALTNVRVLIGFVI